ncbi:hypothetical protein RKE29_09390 [Streptomyces sp. B1866]|uniref:MutS-related protein n=1 Tax=Streptomyces sp. B1866 TaxID=3075431 RepID=UPI00289021AB|nr:hypothetical protein [Streptomyces sp. B1866]MDT3396854.1 hypothetical protein [Streptomyces sp. B1866]
MSADADFDPAAPPPAGHAEVTADLGLEDLWSGMARGDERILAAARAAVLHPLTDPAAIAYRQDVLADCLDHAAAVRSLYDLAAEAVAAEGALLRGAAAGRSEALLGRSLRSLEVFTDHLRRLRAFVTAHSARFRSTGFVRLFAAIADNVDEDYLRAVAQAVEQLQFEHGIAATARLGDDNRSVGFRLYQPPGKSRRSLANRALRASRLSYAVLGQDESDWRALAAFRGRMLADVADAVARSADHVRGFFRALRDELAFYAGCVNLAETLTGLGMPVCRPEVRDAAEGALAARELYEPCLALRRGGPVVGSDLDADGVGLIMVTGTNRGGKSTYLRAVGLAQLMAQCGMFTGARRFAASAADGVLTHFRREEDRTMSSGRLDEELTRMSGLVDRLRPGSLLLCNESFVSTNEREGSDIAEEILRALTESGVRVVFVTHLYDLARRLEQGHSGRRLFLSAGRDAGGGATFRIVPGPPRPTAHGADLYARVFGRPAG